MRTVVMLFLSAASVVTCACFPVNKTKHLLLFSMSLMILGLAACSPAKTQSPVLTQSNVLPSTPQEAKPGPSPNLDSPIRSIDFKNFTYPEIDSRGKFTFKDGHEPTDIERRGFVDASYGDVNGDGKEEALVVHSQSIRGSAIPYFVYIYTMNGDRPKLLWSFYAGERGDGGLRQTYAENGGLVVELYGRDRVVDGGTSSEEDNIGVCCPRFFTRSRYEWRGGRFRLKSKEESIPSPQGNAAYLPLLERRGN